MVKFAHMADVHLGGWKQQPMQDLNFQSFQMAVKKCIDLKVDFVLIAGDLFDSAYPPIEILKNTFAEFRKLRSTNTMFYHRWLARLFCFRKNFFRCFRKSRFLQKCFST